MVCAVALVPVVVALTGEVMAVPASLVKVAAVVAVTVNWSVLLARAGSDLASVTLARLVLVIVQLAPKFADVKFAVMVRVALLTVVGFPDPPPAVQVIVTPGSQNVARVSAIVMVLVPVAPSGTVICLVCP